MRSFLKISLTLFSLFISQAMTFASLPNDQDPEQARQRSNRQILEQRVQNYERQLTALSESNGQKRNVVAKRWHINAMIMGLHADLKRLPVEAMLVQLPAPLPVQRVDEPAPRPRPEPEQVNIPLLQPVVEPAPQPELQPVVEPAPQPHPGPVEVLAPQPGDVPELEHIMQHGRESDSELDSDPDSELDCAPPPSTPTPEPIIAPAPRPEDDVLILDDALLGYDNIPGVGPAGRLVRPPEEFGWRSSRLTQLRNLVEAAYSRVKDHPRTTLICVATASFLVYSKYSTGAWLGILDKCVQSIRKRITGANNEPVFERATGVSFQPLEAVGAGPSVGSSSQMPGNAHIPPAAISGEAPVIEGWPNGLPSNYLSFYDDKPPHIPLTASGYDLFYSGRSSGGGGVPASTSGTPSGSLPLGASGASSSSGTPGGSLPGNSASTALGQSTHGATTQVLTTLAENAAPVVAASASFLPGLKSLGGKQFTITPTAPDGSFLPSFNIYTWKVNYGVAYFDAPRALAKMITKAGKNAGHRIVAVLKGTDIKLKILDEAGKVLDKLKLTTDVYKRA